MDFSTLFLGTAMALLPLIGAGLLAAMVLLERRSEARLAPAGAGTGRGQQPAAGRARTRRQRCAGGRRRKA
jgi:hypothetical protein